MCRDSQLLLFLLSITILAFVLMETLIIFLKKVKKYQNVLNIVLFFFFGHTFFEDHDFHVNLLSYVHSVAV